MTEREALIEIQSLVNEQSEDEALWGGASGRLAIYRRSLSAAGAQKAARANRKLHYRGMGNESS